MTRKATCCCGACNIAVDGGTTLNALCHCSNCKRRTGSAFGWSAYFADSQIRTRSGDLHEIAGAGRLQRRWFCAACGRTLFWTVSWRPGETDIAGGCLEPALAEATATVSKHGRCAWLGLPAQWRTSL
jgi:hypothetical protein